ncbi:MAG: hypothetical protein ACE5JR_13420 [Gemmatimonadota bacterium]
MAGIRDVTGSVSPDGRYYAFTNWQTGQLGVKDLGTGEDRYLNPAAPESPEYPFSLRFAPDGRRIAYAWHTEDGSTELRVINVDGSGVRTLFHDVRGIQPHDWSPDGNHVLAGVDGSAVLISVSDGSLRVLKTFDWRSPLEMRFSPDGRYIAYDLLRREDSATRDIYLLAVDGSREIPLVEGPAIDRVLDWTPDGQRLLFDSDRDLSPGAGRRAWLIEVADGKPIGEPALVTPEIQAIRGLGFSRDGSYYYCCGGEDDFATNLYLATLGAATGKLQTREIIASNLGFATAAEWSPDGRQLAYAWHHWPFPSTLGIRSVETGEERRLPLTIARKKRFGLRWSPDGLSLLVQGRDLKAQWGIYRIDAQTGKATPVVQSCCVGWPTWSPEGQVIFLSWNSGDESRRVVVRDLDTGGEQELYHMTPPAYLSHLAISPDGRWLAFFWAGVPTWWEAQGTWALKVLSLAGGEPRELARLPVHWRFRPSLAWTPDSRHIIYSITTVTEGKPTVTLWRIRAEGGKPQSLSPAMEQFGLYSLTVHPSGQQIAFTGTYLDEVPPISAAEEMWVLQNFLPPLTDER